MISQILIVGAVTSGAFALLAIGFSLIWGVAGIANLSHTAFYMLSGYLVYTLAGLYGLNLPLSVLLSVVITALIGVAIYRLLIHPVRENELPVLIVTVAIALLIQQVLLWTFGSRPLPVPSLVEGRTMLLGVSVLNRRLLALGAIFTILLAVWVFLTKTKLGNAIRSTAQDPEIATLMGINENRIYMITMGIAVGLAAVAAPLINPTLSPLMWLDLLLVVLAVVVLGGLGSIKGSFIGAFILGYAQTAFIFQFPEFSSISSAIPLVLLLIVLVIRPEGLFGVSFEEER